MANSATRPSVNSYKTTHHPKRQRRRDRAKARQHPAYETKDWRWGGPKQTPHRPVENRINHSMKKMSVSMDEAADAFKEMGKIFNQFTDIDPKHTDIIKMEMYIPKKEQSNG